LAGKRNKREKGDRKSKKKRKKAQGRETSEPLLVEENDRPVPGVSEKKKSPTRRKSSKGGGGKWEKSTLQNERTKGRNEKCHATRRKK